MEPTKNSGKAGGTPALPTAQSRGWHYRGYLPHFDGGDISQSATFRLADSLPKAVVDAWQQHLKDQSKKEANKELRLRVEQCLDQGLGECHLRDPRIGGIVERALLFFSDLSSETPAGGTPALQAGSAAVPAANRQPSAGETPALPRYRLHAWVVMPNHVHVLFTPTATTSLSEILHSWKSYTAKQVNRILGRKGQFWEEDYFDRFIRDEMHFTAVAAYIEENPVKAGLCSQPEEWPLSSARWWSSRSVAVADGMQESGRDARAPE